MTGREVQVLHLVMLAVELDVLGRSSTLALRPYDVPVLFVSRATAKLKIKAELRGDQWFYAWGRSPSNRIPVDIRAARGIAAMVTAP
ncbi:hypothetical protein GCM10022254_40140 [Actinomadura meridiana]|uniref:Uncharacterized protein n=1 Tax=Actinomadura meridiana TaxID=559626 RepID=A0ABP8C6W0_9ACTN